MKPDLPRHAPINRSIYAPGVADRALGRKEAARLAALFDDAEREARARLDAATREAEAIFARAKADADAILAMLPDFAALQAAPAGKGRTVLAVLRAVADAHGLPIAALTGTGRDKRARAARREAVLAVIQACPRLGDADIAKFFKAVSAGVVGRLRMEGR